MVDSMPIKKHLFPLYVINWIFGIGIVEYPPGSSHPFYSLIYSLLCLAIYGTIVLTNYQDIIKLSTVENLHVPIIILFLSQIFTTVSTMILGWFRNEASHECVIRASLVDRLMGKIGLDNDPRRLIKVQLWTAVPCSIYVLFMLVASSAVVIAEDLPLSKKFSIGIAINYPVVVMFVADLTFVIIVRSVTYRFEELNHFLENITSNNTKHFEYSFIKPMSVRNTFNIRIDHSPHIGNHAYAIERVRQIHLLLNKLCLEADNMYGLQILISIIVTFAVLIVNMYMLYMVFVDINIPRDELFKSIIASFIWCTYYTLKITKFSLICSYCVQQSIKTGDIINKLYDVSDSETQKEIRQFNVQLIQSPLKFRAYGFVDLDNTLIQGMIASITTYLMILIQLGKLPSVENVQNNFSMIFNNVTTKHN